MPGSSPGRPTESTHDAVRGALDDQLVAQRGPVDVDGRPTRHHSLVSYLPPPTSALRTDEDPYGCVGGGAVVDVVVVGAGPQEKVSVTALAVFVAGLTAGIVLPAAGDCDST